MAERATWATYRATAFAAAAGALLCTLAAGQTGAAAQLPVEAAPLQFWDVRVQVELPEELLAPQPDASVPDALEGSDPGRGGDGSGEDTSSDQGSHGPSSQPPTTAPGQSGPAPGNSSGSPAGEPGGDAGDDTGSDTGSDTGLDAGSDAASVTGAGAAPTDGDSGPQA